MTHGNKLNQTETGIIAGKYQETDYDELIFSWYKKAVSQDYFSKFVFLYLAFIAFLRNKRFPDSITDRDVIENLKSDSEIKKEYYERVRFDKSLEVLLGALVRELKKKPLINVSVRKRKEIIISSIEDWGNLIEFIYSVRNNLFHGEKDPEKSRDLMIAYYAFKVLYPLVDIFVGKLDLAKLHQNAKRN